MATKRVIRISPAVINLSDKDCAAILRSILARFPDLGRYGFVTDPDEVGEHDLNDFIEAFNWIIDNLRPIRSINDQHSSYVLCQVARHDIGPVDHGTFIAAMIAACYKVARGRPGDPHAWFNVSKKSVKAAIERTGASVVAHERNT